MLARYRYRVYPSPGQVMMLARTFGCARTVFNDALRTREEAHAAGEKVSDTEVQRRVITLAKGTPEREWLVGFQNSATGLDLGVYAARSYSLMRPPRTGRRLIRSWVRSAAGWSGRGGRSWRLRWGRRPL
jgi:hypothetical protein